MQPFQYLREITFFFCTHRPHLHLGNYAKKNYECVEICVKGTKAFQGIALPQCSQNFYQVSLEFYIYKTFDNKAAFRMKMSCDWHFGWDIKLSWNYWKWKYCMYLRKKEKVIPISGWEWDPFHSAALLHFDRKKRTFLKGLLFPIIFENCIFL